MFSSAFSFPSDDTHTLNMPSADHGHETGIWHLNHTFESLMPKSLSFGLVISIPFQIKRVHPTLCRFNEHRGEQTSKDVDQIA
jgi:hypothetical protein